MKDPFIEIHRLLKEKQYSEILHTILRSDNELREPYDQDENHAWYIIGDIFYKQENYKDAIHSFKKAIESRKDDVEAYLALGNCYSAENDFSKSAYYCNEGLKFSPHNSSLHYNLGNALFDLKDYEKAISAYQKVNIEDVEIYELAQKNIKRAEKLKKLEKH